MQSEVGDGLVYLQGGGDFLLAPGAGDPVAVNGRAGLGDLADQVAAELRLTGETTVRVALDDSLFDGSLVSPAWDESVVNRGFVAPVTALAVDAARLDEEKYAQRAADPSMAAAKTFAEALEDRGIEVSGSPVRATVPTGTTELGSVSSAPVRQLVDYFLQESDNSITEVVGRLVAIESGLPATWTGATRAVVAATGRLGVDTTGMTLADLSGLADGSRVSADQLGHVLQAMTNPELDRLRSGAVGLPVGGLTGTLSERFVGEPAAGLTRAKTGSLRDVTALAGTVMTADGRMLTYVIVVDDTKEPFGAMLIFDDFVDELASCGCGG
ncbi:hypothetical protein GCM10025865_18930 [Paraoerskovia sediminicola]|uniref:D-alanyl-D-alanine carboxypeptidase / D-alanyl-D-alanine-endopeptidase (Penicillin-binding protein 4) n=1 Tax=Paraoerskovia sediminicola TaxID=1138587 RepID=A0ABM8G3I1_9CELL|nr:hypothetical protein GCM10025865_18930 [Paraoerskovia sediminicola]